MIPTSEMIRYRLFINFLPDWDEQLTPPQTNRKRPATLESRNSSKKSMAECTLSRIFRSLSFFAFYAVSGLLNLRTALTEAMAAVTPGLSETVLPENSGMDIHRADCRSTVCPTSPRQAPNRSPRAAAPPFGLRCTPEIARRSDE
ncbi:MAG: hypothetical protein K2F92_08375 [Alistipes sp.]|nr:hypothetical protein [Alistipes sp.]